MRSVLLFLLLAALAVADAPVVNWWDDPADDADKAVMSAFAGARQGMILWESLRPTGNLPVGTLLSAKESRGRAWRIWKRDLDGNNLAMISGEAGDIKVQHAGGCISPYGDRVAYARVTTPGFGSGVPGLLFGDEYFTGSFYDPNDPFRFEIWVVDANGKNPHRVIGDARGAGEDRICEWIDNDHLAVITGDNCYRVRVPREGPGWKEAGVMPDGRPTGADGLIVQAIQTGNGTWRYPLSNASGQYAYWAMGGEATVYTINAQHQPVLISNLIGCQTRISADGRWAVTATFRPRVTMGGEDRIWNMHTLTNTGDTTGAWDTLVHESLVPAPQIYDYFPNISNDNTIGLLSFAPNHSHIWADYDVFAFDLQDNGAGIPVAKGPLVRYSHFGKIFAPLDTMEYDPQTKELFGAVERYGAVWVKDRVLPAILNLDTFRLAFESAAGDLTDPPEQFIHPLNPGDVPLPALTLAGLPAWVAAEVRGTGDAQLIAVRVLRTGLPTKIHYASALVMGDSVTSVSFSLTYRVGGTPVANRVELLPSTTVCTAGDTLPFTARVFDQFGDPMAATGVVWTSSGNVSATGRYACGTGAGADTVTAAVGAASASASVERLVLPAAAKKFWFRAHQGVTVAGGSVSRWDDGSGNEAHALDSAGSGPALRGVAVNGLPALYFNGTDFLNLNTQATNFTFLGVWNQEGITRTHHFVLSGLNHTGNSNIVAGGTFGPMSGYLSMDGNGVNALMTSQSPVTGQNVLFGLDNSHIFLNGQSLGLVTKSSTYYRKASLQDVKFTCLGNSYFDPKYGFQGNIAEMMMFDTILPDAERAVVEYYLTKKYALNGTTVWAPPAGRPWIRVTSPNGLERYHAGDVMQVRWETSDLGVGSVVLDLTLDGGVTWTPLTRASITREDDSWGNFAWVVPALAPGTSTPLESGMARVRVSDYVAYAILNDVSDGYFGFGDVPIDVRADAPAPFRLRLADRGAAGLLVWVPVGAWQVDLYDLAGRPVFRRSGSGAGWQVLPADRGCSGVHVLRVTTDGKSQMRRVFLGGK